MWTSMKLKVRDIPVGMRFILIRTGQIFTRVEGFGMPNSPFQSISNPRVIRPDGEVSTLHHSSHVKPIYKYGAHRDQNS